MKRLIGTVLAVSCIPSAHVSKTGILVAGAAVTGVLLAGCANPGTSGDNAPTSKPAPAQQTTPMAQETTSSAAGSPGAIPVTVGCDAAPMSLVGATLNLPLIDATAQSLGGIMWCSYTIGGAGSVILLMETGVTPDQFDQSASLIPADLRATYTDLPSFEDRAFAHQSMGIPVSSNTVAALKGRAEVIIISRASVDAEKALVAALLTRLVGQ
jgi:hypothetical protein